MKISHFLNAALASALLSTPAIAQDTPERSQISLGNGASNMIEVSGMTRKSGPVTTTDLRTDDDQASVMRANSTSITFPKVVAAQPSWIVLHPVIDGRPDGDIVSGYTYLDAGESVNVTITMAHPASAGDKYLVMLHKDKDEDRVFDFVFVEDGVNVEDTAVFEGNRMIAHLISLSE